MPVIAYPIGDENDPILVDNYTENIIPYQFYFHPHSDGDPLTPDDYLIPLFPWLVPSGVYPSGVMPSGVFPSGLLPSGLFPSGIWPSGLFPSGLFPSGLFPSGLFPSGIWPSGMPWAGILPSGIWPSGVYPSGVFPSGIWPSGVFPSGIWPSGLMPSGIWPSGMPDFWKWLFSILMPGGYPIPIGTWDPRAGWPYDSTLPWEFSPWWDPYLDGEIVWITPWEDYRTHLYFDALEYVESAWVMAARERVVQDRELTLPIKEFIISLMSMDIELVDDGVLRVIWSKGMQGEQTVPQVEVYKKITSDKDYGPPVGTFPWSQRHTDVAINEQPHNIRILGANGTGHALQDMTIGIGTKTKIENTMYLGTYEKIFMFNMVVNPRATLVRNADGTKPRFVIPLEVKV